MKFKLVMRVAQLVGDSLTDELRKKPWRGHKHPMAGHCYVAAEALFHLLGGKLRGFRSHFIRHQGAPHWYLSYGERGLLILDVTASQFKKRVPYSEGRGKGFLTRDPSARAQVVIARVLKRLTPYQRAILRKL